MKTVISTLCLLASLATLRASELSIAPLGGHMKIGVRAEAGQNYVLEGARFVGPNAHWDTLFRGVLPVAQFDWFDQSGHSSPARFYRLRQLPFDAQQLIASNFRLLDQEGKTRELRYNWHYRAVVLAFISDACPETAPTVAALESLRAQYQSQDVLFWLISLGGESTPSELASLAASLNTTLPVLPDAGHLLARDLEIDAAPEVFGINTADWTVFYRGALQTQEEPGVPSERLLKNAVDKFLAGQSIAISQTESSGCAVELPAPPSVSYSADIAPLLQRNCVSCHSPGNIAPWAMTSHSAVKAQAPYIKQEVLARRMPPWHADPHYSTFSNDTSLTTEEIGKLVQWIREDCPRGAGSDPLADLFAANPPGTGYPFAWPKELGTPDKIIKIPVQNIPAFGQVDYQYPVVNTGLSSNVWLRAAVVKPGNTRVVHHCLIFAGNLLQVIRDGAGLNGFFAGYVPGRFDGEFPVGTAKSLAANSVLTFQMHYTTVGEEQTDQTELGLYFAPAPPAAPLITGAASTTSIAIPPETRDYERTAELNPSPNRDFVVYEFGPHMHYRGSRIKYEAIYPGGNTEVLLSVPKYDFDWQTLYRLAEPKRFPKGTIIRCVGAFDNTAQNPKNPNPLQAVGFGEQTEDEMFIGYFNYSLVP